MAHGTFDLIVIGSGPAGQKAALCAAKQHKRVALVDRQASIGGVCTHTGTIPSKAIREAVLHLTGVRERATYGADYHVKHDVTMDDLLHRANHVIRAESGIVHEQMHRNGVSVFYGRASFRDEHTVAIEHDDDTMLLRGDRFLIAVGTTPARPKDVPFTPGMVIDSDEFLSLRSLPREMIIVGGGVIGSEYAAMMAAAGVKVTLVEGRPKLLDFVDDEIAEHLQFRMRDMGVRLRLGEKVEAIKTHGKPYRRKNDPALHHTPYVEATLCSGKRLTADCLLYCIGRQGATDYLNPAAAGLAVDNRGRLTVNEHYQTEKEHIYAAGDVIGFPALAATSMEQGRLAACHMFGQVPVGDYEGKKNLMPFGIYTIPEISLVGKTEQTLTAENTCYEVGLARYREIARGQLMSDPNGFLKLLFCPTSRRLLGVHAVGTGATELVHVGQAIMAAGLPIDYFVETVFNYPTLAECYKVATLDGLNRLRHQPAVPATAVAEKPAKKAA